MPAWLVPVVAKLSRRAVRWDLIWRAARWLYTKGRGMLEDNLTERERRELAAIMRKSKGRPSNISSRERERMRALVRKALTGRAS